MADNQRILKLIEQAVKQGLAQLDLSHQGLTTLPPEIKTVTRLTKLDLSNNQLTSLPPEIAELEKLIFLDVSENQLTSLPPEIGSLSNLFYLNLSQNQLTGLPPEITKLRCMKHLDIHNNQLIGLPAEMTGLTSLTNLILYNNQLKTFREITTLTNLEYLDLVRNNVRSVPPEITKLANLKHLYLTSNQLTSVPIDITYLKNLATLDLRGNEIPLPPETLVNSKDVSAIFAAVAGLIGGARLNEAKMLVVGDPKVGKSSVVEMLIYGTFNSKKETTLGIDINDEINVLQSEVKGEGEPVKLNIWDFGGQEIQHSTHQFFLTTRSLYLLVVDARKGDQISSIEYWLKLIRSFGGDSPILIVVNQIDQLRGQRPLNLDRKALQQKYHIKGFIESSCGTGEGISTLKATIAREIEQLKHVRDIWPREWLAVKERLKRMHADYIPVEKYMEICEEEHLIDDDVCKSLLGLLHDLGVVIRFPGDTQVLNPRWVTQGVYGLLTSKQLVESHGQFDLEDVGRILAGLSDAQGHYPSHTHERLIRVMRHFELCFEFTDRPGHYLIPGHLLNNEPDTAWDDSDALEFQYHYATLPDSVISRFIVRMNQYITERRYWKNGVFLKSGEDDKNQARVKADMVDRKVFISVTGNKTTRRAFLAVIRSAFDEINSNFKIEIKQMIPVPGFLQVLVSFEHLLAYEESEEIAIFIPELRQKFEVKKLLAGVEESGTRAERLLAKGIEGSQTKTQPRVHRVVVASPADVQPERDVLPSVIEEINRGVAADRGLRLELSRWETDTHPGFHIDGPQGLIDPILRITDCDLLIGIFWKRFGTTASDGTTGTEHEFNLAQAAWQEKGSPQIFLYFNEKASNPKSTADIEQWGRVVAFREKFPKEGLWWPYKGKIQFEKLVRNHLMNYIRSLPS